MAGKKRTPASSRPAAAPTTPQGEKSLGAIKPPSSTAELVDMELDNILDQIREGALLREVVATLPAGMTVGKLIYHLSLRHDEAYQAALKTRAHALVNEMHENAKDAMKGKADPQAIRIANDTLRWIAGKFNRQYADKYTDNGGVGTSSSVDAIKALSAQPSAALPPLPTPIEEDKP